MATHIQGIDANVMESFGPENKFFLDANILLYLHYPPALSQNLQEASQYANFVSELSKLGCLMAASVFSVQEAFHAIERIEWHEHCRENNVRMSKKDFRIQHRSQVESQQNMFWEELKAKYYIEGGSVTKDMLEGFVAGYNQHHLDPMDYIFIENHRGCDFITADSDFLQEIAVNVFTY